MGRRSIFFISSVLLILVIVSIVFLKSPNNQTNSDIIPAAQSSTAGTEDTKTQTTQNEAAVTGATEQAVTAEQGEAVASEDIDVVYNSPEYDLKAVLYEKSDKQTFLKLEYYFDGASTVKELDSTMLPEIKDIFSLRNEHSSEDGAYKVKCAYLNSRYGKIYLQINGGSSEGFSETSLYRIDLKDAAVKKIVSYPGKYSKMYFNKDLSLLGYSFEDPPHLSVYQEKTLLEIINCETDEFIVKGSRDRDNRAVGTNREPDNVYDYQFVSWHSNAIVRLKQASWLKKDSTGKVGDEKEVLYDIIKNVFMNTDGSLIKASEESPGTTVSDAVADSEALKALKDFYSYLASEKDYGKAMDLLDEGFKLQLGILKQAGYDEISKADIDLKDASIYGEMLKAASLETIVKEESKNGTTTIYYYQALELNAETRLRQALVVEVVKKKEGCKIVLMKDGDEGKPPFAQ